MNIDISVYKNNGAFEYLILANLGFGNTDSNKLEKKYHAVRSVRVSFYPIDRNLQICPLNPGVIKTRAPNHEFSHGIFPCDTSRFST